MRTWKKIQLALRLTVVLVFLWVVSVLGPWYADYISGHSWFEYTDDDGGPEKVCNCSAILRGEREELEQAKILSITKDFRKSVKIPDEYYIKETQDCSEFKLKRKYLTFPLSKEEEEFPLAYSMVVHHKVQNFERLLRAIYAPQNLYCVHIDKKANISVFSAVSAIVSCFPNVFMVSRPVSVVYAAWPRVQADINCMADLYKYDINWKYFINVCGQDFPLKTNLEIVRTLRSLKGGNSMESEKMPDGKIWRVKNVHQIVDGQIEGTGKVKDPPPFNLPIFSGNAYIVVNRGYIRSVLEDDRVQALIEWAKDTYSPDEFLWSTIQRMPEVPGSKWPSPKYDMSDLNAVARLVKWHSHEGSQGSLDAVYPKCNGNHVREICVYGAGDLQWMIEQHHLFANKFDTDTDAIAVYCLERYLRTKALAELH